MANRFTLVALCAFLLTCVSILQAENPIEDLTTCTPPSPDALCTPPSSFDVEITLNGGTLIWDENHPMLGDCQDFKMSAKITGTGTVRVPNSLNLQFKSSDALLYIDGPNLVVNGGNMQLDETGARFIMIGGILQIFGQFQQKEETVECITGTLVEVGDEDASASFTVGQFNDLGNNSSSSDWQNDGGYRYLKDLCVNVTHDFQLQSSGSGTGINGVDVIIDCCFEIGDRGHMNATLTPIGYKDGDDSGNWQNSNRQYIFGTDIIVANGDFQNSNNTMTVCDVDVKLNKSGNFQIGSGSTLEGQGLCIAAHDAIENSGTWTADVVAWYSKLQNSIIENETIDGYIPPHETAEQTIIDLCFAYCCMLNTDDRDYGDLPMTYGDASHIRFPGLMIGHLIDAEAITPYSMNADGDDSADSSDEDGVTWNTGDGSCLGAPGSTQMVDVDLTNMTGHTVYLRAWIDFNRNGTFEASELIIDDFMVPDAPAAVTYNFTYMIPATALTGFTGVRFRLSAMPNVGPKGDQNRGEVEDYVCHIDFAVPVELSQFTAEKMGDAVALDWSTQTELENKGFYVERSLDGVNWEMLGFVEGIGNSTQAQDYQFMDYRPINGLNYYRLQQVDMDGHFEYSNVQMVSFSSKGNEVSVHPNPTSGLVYYDLGEQGEVSGNLEIYIYDVHGQLLRSEQASGDANAVLDMRDLPAGLYHTQFVKNGQTIGRHTVVKSR